MVNDPRGACGTCAYAVVHGWWGPDHQGTHCRGCHRSWRSRREAHCATCHAHFTSPSAFGLHLTSRGCVDPATLRAKSGALVLVEQERAHGVVWACFGERPAFGRAA